MTLLLILLGTFIAIFERFATASKKTDFHFKVFFQKNWTLFVMHLLTSLSLYFAVFHGEVDPIWTIKSINFNAFYLVVVITGASSLYAWKLLMSTYKLIFEKLLNKILKK